MTNGGYIEFHPVELLTVATAAFIPVALLGFAGPRFIGVTNRKARQPASVITRKASLALSMPSTENSHAARGYFSTDSSH